MTEDPNKIGETVTGIVTPRRRAVHSDPAEHSVEDEALPGGGRREKYVLSEMVGNALTMPGGKARKAMQGQYGQRLVGPRR